jgi:oligosaccharide repeat unit polymerase
MSQMHLNPIHFVSVIGIILIYLLTEVPDNFLIFLSNFLILVMSYLGMMSNKKQTYSLTAMIYIFGFFFFGLIPLNDLSNGNIYWGAAQFVNEFSQIITNLLIIIGGLAFWIGSKVKVRFFKFLPKVFSPKISLKKLWILIFFITVIFSIFYYIDFDIYRIFFRSFKFDVYNLGTDTYISLSQVERLFFANFFRPLPFIIFFIYVYIYRLHKFSPSKLEKKPRFTLSKVFLLLLFIFSVFSTFPTSLYRYQVAALYIPIIITFTSFWNKPYRMQATILAMLLIMFPFLDKFRELDFENFTWSIDFSTINHGHFDAYQNFSRVVEINLVTYGSQLVGSLLFFIPRSFWESKPIGSGAFLADTLNYDFNNISMPLIGEGFINFGLIGVVIFMFIYGLILGNLDRVAWQIKKKKTPSLFIYYYYFLFGSVFLIMRGDLVSSLAHTVGLTSSFLLAVYLLRILNYRFRLRL